MRHDNARIGAVAGRKNGILKPGTVVGSVMPEMVHQETTGRDVLECRRCGATFPEGRATTDGWHYRCPECEEAEGIGQGLRRTTE
jgi:hypothetical protein